MAKKSIVLLTNEQVWLKYEKLCWREVHNTNRPWMKESSDITTYMFKKLVFSLDRPLSRETAIYKFKRVE